MDCIPAVKKCLLFLLSLYFCSSEHHSLQYITTAVTPGAGLPEYTVVGQVDGEQFVYYDSNIKEMIPKTDWIKKIVEDDPDYWARQNTSQESVQEIVKANLIILMKRFNQTKGVHTLQRFSGCELDDDETSNGYFQFGYDGEDFLSLDLITETWTAVNYKAFPTKQKWENARDVYYRKNYLENECIDYLKKYVNYSRSNLERKVRPEVSLFQKDSSSEVVCHATGFFPKAVMISWQKNGEDLNEDVELRETLPNQDGTFQKISILTVSPEELKNNKYTCVVHHSSLERDLVLQASDRRVLSGDSDGVPMAVIIGVAVSAVVLLVLVVIVGVCILKIKRGFKSVPVSDVHCASDHESNSTNS